MAIDDDAIGPEAPTRRELPGERTRDPATPSASAFDPAKQRFAIGDELGRGGMGRVVAATDTSLDRPVAIKQVLNDDAEDLIRFEREVRITAQLEHPSIVPIHDAGRDEQGRPYYVMRQLDGEPLSDRLERAADARERLSLLPNVLAVVDAAAFAHARGVIHRDIKPWNILVGAYGETLLIDWGLARKLDEADVPSPSSTKIPSQIQLTRAGHAYGTPGYMAPEQARGEQVDARADVYALGATLFHVLSGATPFAGSSETEWMARVEKALDPPVAKLPSSVPPELVAIVSKAMASAKADRYRDAGELATDLRAFLAGQLVAAHHYTTAERIARFARRHRIAIAIAAVAIAVVIVVGVLALRGIVHERDLADEARIAAEADRQRLSDKAEANLLDRASTLAPLDPTRALALLRRLPASSHYMERARDIASSAAASGIVHGTPGTLDSINVLLISPDGRSVMSVGERGIVRIHDLATGRLVSIGESVGKNVTEAAWTDGGRTITLNAYPRGLFAIDIATRAKRTLDPDVVVGSLWASDDTHVRYVDLTRGVLLERSMRDPTQLHELATDVQWAVNAGEITIVDGDAGVRLLGRDRTIMLVRHDKSRSSRIAAISLPLGRVAAAVGKEVIEWNIADGSVIRRWPVSVTTLIYGPSLFAASGRGEIVSLGAIVHTIYSTNRSSVAWPSVTRGGSAFVFDDGTLVVIDGAGLREFPFDRPGSRALATSPISDVVATSSRDGAVRWWHLSDIAPVPLPASGGAFCWATDKMVYLVETLHIRGIDRTSGATTTMIETGFDSGLMTCTGMIETRVVVGNDRKHMIVDTGTGEIRHLSTDVSPLVDPVANVVVYARDNQLIELAHARGPELVRWVAPTTITSLAMTEHWLWLALADSSFVQFDRETGATRSMRVAGLEAYGGFDTGDAWYMVGNVLWRWDGTSTRRVHEFPHRVAAGSTAHARLFLGLTDGSLWLVNGNEIIDRAPAARQRRVVFGTRDVVLSHETDVRTVMYHLGTGEHTVRAGPIMSSLGLAADERTMVALGPRAVVVYVDPVPTDPAKLHAWIDTATNAYLEPETDELTWR